jgi:hypothetical protein
LWPCRMAGKECMPPYFHCLVCCTGWCLCCGGIVFLLFFYTVYFSFISVILFWVQFLVCHRLLYFEV